MKDNYLNESRVLARNPPKFISDEFGEDSVKIMQYIHQLEVAWTAAVSNNVPVSMVPSLLRDYLDQRELIESESESD